MSPHTVGGEIMKKLKTFLVVAIVLCFAMALCVGCKKDEDQPPAITDPDGNPDDNSGNDSGNNPGGNQGENPSDNSVKTLDEFMTAIAERDTITLGENIALTDQITVNRKVTIELNGKELTSPKSVIVVENGGELTINGEGNVIGGKGGDYTAITVRGADAKATLNGGNYTVGSDAEEKGNSCIYAVGGGHVYITGGKYSTEAKYNDRYYVLNIANGSGSVIEVSGGSFVGQNPADGDDKDGGTFLKSGYVSTESNGMYVVSAMSEE